MRFLMSILSLLYSFSISATAKVDKTEKLAGVNLSSSKEDAVRTYSGSSQRLLPFPLDLVRKGVTNFSDRCNNKFKQERRFTPKNLDCKYHNDNLVETVVIRDIRHMDYFSTLAEAYILGRRIYNRSHFGYYELVTIREGVNERKQKTVTIALRMLDDKEVRLFTAPKFDRESAFDQSLSTFTLTEVSPNETSLKYEYEAQTDHWLLNKEVSVPQVFASISRSINDLLRSIEAESLSQKRELASKE